MLTMKGKVILLRKGQYITTPGVAKRVQIIWGGNEPTGVGNQDITAQ